MRALAPVNLRDTARELNAAYEAWLASRGRGNRADTYGARRFFIQWPDPAAWAGEPLAVRLAARSHTRPLLNFLMLHGHLRPGYDYLLERKLSALNREITATPLAGEFARFLQAAQELNYSLRCRLGMASQVAARLLIQTGRPLEALNPDDFAEFERALSAREGRHGRAFKHYRTALFAARTVIYHLGSSAEPVPKRSTLLGWSWPRHMEGVTPGIRQSLIAYLECAAGTRARSTVKAMASLLAHFGRHLRSIDPDLNSLADLDRQRHIEPYLAVIAQARHRRTSAPLTASHRKRSIGVVKRMLEDIHEWGWAESPARRLIFSGDIPRIPQPLPRYLSPDQDRRVVAALEASPNRLRADALLLLRATGLRIGELRDLELDCVHEIPGLGAWLKVPLGKLQTERMVPLDDDALAIVDRIATARSPGRPLRHSRTGRLVESLLTHQGRRVSADMLRDELHRAAIEAGLSPVNPHQLRHTYATALVNAGVSLQSLMALLGHQTAEMSLRYGKLFDATVRADYERALVLAKERLGPILPAAPTDLPGSRDWKQLPLLKSRLAGGYCIRTAAQGVCPYTHICEHCPNFRSEPALLHILAAQRADTEALAMDAQARGWIDEADRHRRLIERLDLLMSQTKAS